MWKVKGLSHKSIKPIAASNISLASALNHINPKMQVKFDGIYLKHEKVTFTDKQVVNIYFVYDINLYLQLQSEVKKLMQM